ncbi:MAG: hypothetical protein IKZ82_12235 [Clostridia bacterium]|nr:hypothetical protein [Clostridia bacterium]
MRLQRKEVKAMVICALAFVCVGYNALYLSHCIKQRRVKPALGSAAVIGLIAAGVLLLGFDAAW